MADRIYFVDEDITLDLGQHDLGHPGRPDLWDRLREDQRKHGWGPGHFQCIECHATEPGNPQWMTLRERDGKRQSVHLNSNIKHHSRSVGPEHLALQERIATAAQLGGFEADIEERSAGGDIRSDVLVHGADGSLLGCEVQLSHQTAERTRDRSAASREHGITPLWTTVDPKAHLIDQAPWTRIDKQPPEMVRAGNELLVRGGARTLATYPCDHTLPTPCPKKGRGRCGQLHFRWELKHGLMFDDLIRHAAALEWVPLERTQGRGSNWMWVSAQDRDRFADARDSAPPKEERQRPQAQERAEANGRVCTYGQDPGIRSAPKSLRDTGEAFMEAITVGGGAPESGTALPAQVAEWIAGVNPRGIDTPCSHYLGAQSRHCGATPTRHYQQGRRCYDHAPVATRPVHDTQN